MSPTKMTTGDSDSASSPGSESDVPSSQKSRNGKTSHHGSSKSSRHKDPTTKIIQVANIAPQAKREEIQTLFGYLGKIDDLRLYPTVDVVMLVSSKICFIKFYDASSVGISQHLTNTVFIDRALIVVPYMESEIPDEQKGLEFLTSGSLLPGIADPKLPQHVTSQLVYQQMEGIPPYQVVATDDPKLAENGLPVYPHLSPSLDTRRIEEIRRTVLLANVDHEMTSQQVVDHFNRVGEVKYFRFCTRDNDPLQYGLLEFSEQPSILKAMGLNGSKFGSKIIKVYHATQAILKPQAKTNEAAQKEIEDALSRQTFMSQTLESKSSTATQHMGIPRQDKRRSRSRDRDRRRSRSRDRRRSSRSRSKRRSRSRSKRRSTSRTAVDYGRTKPKRSRTRSRDRRRSRSRKRSRSHGRHRRRSRSRSRSKEKKKKDKKDKDRDKKDKDRDKDKNRDKDKERVDREKDRKERENGVKIEDSKVSAD